MSGIIDTAGRPLIVGTVDSFSAGVMRISAGTETASGTITFSNSNGVSFGLNAGVLTASAVGGGGGSINFSAGTTSGNLNSVVFSNSNGVSFGLNGSTITASAAAGAGAGLSAGTQSVATGTVKFADSNGISFGMSLSSQITASYTVPSTAGLISAVNVSAGTTSSNLSQIKFSDSNGVSFGLGAGSVVTATVKTDYLTTQTNQSLGLYASSQTTGQSSSTTVDARSLTVRGAGIISVGYSAGELLVSASAAGAADGVNILAAGTQTAGTNTTVKFADSNGISFGMSNSSQITASYTVPTITSWTVSDAATSITVARLAFSQSNGLTLSLSTTTGGSATVVGSYTVPNTAGLISAVNFSAGTTSSNLTQVKFSDSNGISFGLGANSIITATVKTDYLTSQSNQAVSGSNASSTFQTVTFGSSNGMHFYLTNGSVVGSYTVPAAQTGISGLAGSNTTYSSGTVILSDQTNITIGSSVNGASQYLRFSVGNYITTARASNDAIGLNTAQTNVTWTVNSSGLSLNAAGYAGTGTSNTGAASFTLNSNGLAFNGSSLAGVGTGFTGANISGSMTHNTAGLSLSLSVAPPGAAAENNWFNLTGNTAGNTTASGSTILLSATGNVTLSGTNGSQIIISAGGGGGGAALGVSNTGHTAGNTGTYSSGTIVLAGSSSLTLSQSTGGAGVHTIWLQPAMSQLTAGAGISLSSNGSTISVIAIPTYTALTYQNRQFGASTTINSAGGQNTLWLTPFRLVAPVSASTAMAAIMSYSGTITSAATAQNGHTFRAVIYSQHTDPASTSRFDSWWSRGLSMTFWNSGTSSYSYAISNSAGSTTSSSAGSNLGTASIMGARLMLLDIGTAMTAGLYVFGVLNSTSSAGYSAAMSREAMYMDNPASVGMATLGSATNNSLGVVDAGSYGTTTNGIPASVALADIKPVANLVPFFKIGAI